MINQNLNVSCSLLFILVSLCQHQDIDARVEFERELRQQLSRQAAAHSDHLQDVLQVQEQELQEQCEREVHMQLLQERQSFQTEVAGWIARLKGIETAVEGEGSLLCC